MYSFIIILNCFQKDHLGPSAKSPRIASPDLPIRGKRQKRVSQDARVKSVRSLLNGWIKGLRCKRESERERERTRGGEATRYRSDKRYKNTKKKWKEKSNRYICDCDFWGETLVCEESTFYTPPPERSTVLATLRDHPLRRSQRRNSDGRSWS